MLMPSNQLTAAPPSETRWFLYLPWQPTWILAPGMSLFFSLNLMSCCCLVANLVRLFAIPWAVAHQAPLSMGFPRQEYWSGLPYPSPGNLPDSGIEPASPAWADGFFFFNCWAFREAFFLIFGLLVNHSSGCICISKHHKPPGARNVRSLLCCPEIWVHYSRKMLFSMKLCLKIAINSLFWLWLFY